MLEEEYDISSSDSCSSSDDECANFCLMARKKGGTLKIYNSDSENEYTYTKLSMAFNDMYADLTKEFKKSLSKKKWFDNLNRR